MGLCHMEGNKLEMNIQKVVLISLIMISIFSINDGLCLEVSVPELEEPEMLLPPPDDYAEVQAKINQLNEDLTYKNMEVAKAAQGYVKNPGIINGKVLVITGHSSIPERHSENTIVYLETVNGNNYKPISQKHILLDKYIAHTKEKGLSAEPPIMDQWNVEFIPHALPVLKGSTIDFPNTDIVRHNVYSPEPIPGERLKISLGTYDPNVIKTIRLDKAGVVPLRCNVHQEMSAFIVVLDNPYFTVTNRRGEFTIDNVPHGKFTIKTWHEKHKSVSMEVIVKPNQTTEVELPNISEKY